MSLKIVLDQNQQASGVFIPLEDWKQLNATVRPNTPLYELMEELTVPNKIREIRQNYILPSGFTMEEAEHISRSNVEDIYIKAFAKGIPRYYKDERCTGEYNSIKANPDGSEDLVDFDWQTGQDTFIKNLLPAGKGKYSYLLHDSRYLALKVA